VKRLLLFLAFFSLLFGGLLYAGDEHKMEPIGESNSFLYRAGNETACLIELTQEGQPEEAIKHCLAVWKDWRLRP